MNKDERRILMDYTKEELAEILERHLHWFRED